MGAHTSFGIHDPDRCLAGANPLAPDLMSAEERLSELGQILAAGLRRLRLLEKKGLDSSPDRSGHADTLTRRTA